MLHWSPKKEREREGEREGERGREGEGEREREREGERVREGNQYLCSYWPLFFQEFSDGREETSI